MATPRETPFSAFDFSEQELIEAVKFSPTQRQFFQTQLSEVAMSKLAEEFDSLNPVKFAQRESYSRGQMDILNYLLAENFVAALPSNPHDTQEGNS